MKLPFEYGLAQAPVQSEGDYMPLCGAFVESLGFDGGQSWKEGSLSLCMVRITAMGLENML